MTPNTINARLHRLAVTGISEDIAGLTQAARQDTPSDEPTAESLLAAAAQFTSAARAYLAATSPSGG